MSQWAVEERLTRTLSKLFIVILHIVYFPHNRLNTDSPGWPTLHQEDP